MTDRNISMCCQWFLKVGVGNRQIDVKSTIQPSHGRGRGKSNDEEPHTHPTFSLSGFIAECVYTAFQVKVSVTMVSQLTHCMIFMQ